MPISKYKKLYEKTGEAATLELLAEECTELAHASLKLARKCRKENPTHDTILQCVERIHEEIADVELVIEVLCCADWYDPDKCTRTFYSKLNRWLTRLGVKHGQRNKRNH